MKITKNHKVLIYKNFKKNSAEDENAKKKSLDRKQDKSFFTQKIEKFTGTTLQSYSLYIAESAWLAAIVSLAVFLGRLISSMFTKIEGNFFGALAYEALRAANYFIFIFFVVFLSYVITALFAKKFERSKNEAKKLLFTAITGLLALSFCIYTSIHYS